MFGAKTDTLKNAINQFSRFLYFSVLYLVEECPQIPIHNNSITFAALKGKTSASNNPNK